ncbi:transposase [Hymenobacter sp. M29]|uniref:Transposase n=1 Tax=Hymenobacter mellowenesis TaxID=3063995 RepID=A0ABT9AF69_9BACT|nr:transposase [Hymenobacter sp. M29]MDO7848469.1 transposase [Hymenobacter sp. M29]
MYKLPAMLKALFLDLGHLLNDLNTAARYVIDSFPVAVCGNVRSGRSRLVHGAAYRGYQASKRRYFYGVKVQLLITHDGLLVERYIHVGSEADIRGLEALGLQLPAGSTLYANAAYTDYDWKDAWREVEHVDLKADRRRGQQTAAQTVAIFSDSPLSQRCENRH